MTAFIKRNCIEEITKHLQSKEITILVGPRQAGKTTIMLHIKEQLDKQGAKTLHLNIDQDDHRVYFNSQTDLVNYLKLYFGAEKGYLFIDEIQRLDNAGLFLKGIYDRNLPYKMIVSGSGSLELKEKIHESLAGRKRIFEIPTITFSEFINFKTNYQFINKVNDFFKYDKTLPETLLQEYLYFGGYPKVVLANTIEEKGDTIKEIYNSYVEKDIQNLIHIEKTENFINLVSVLSSQIGQLVNRTELSQTLNIDRETLKTYLWYLEKTFIIKRINPFFSNIRKELTKMPIFYFTDIGLRNYNRNQFMTPPNKTDGFLFQNFIYQLLKESKMFNNSKINFWRTKDGAEVDFIAHLGSDIIPIEVKNSSLDNIDLNQSIHSFIAFYKPRKLYLINKSLDSTLVVNNCEITAIPFFKLL
ncbi:MAG: hypothetical protein ACD_12C00312G0013 [uncultured bacterium]|nr:MAG: hypothetical protein ACD_12C00312G0013 [uncultured bacterium]